jgi:cytochrome P450
LGKHRISICDPKANKFFLNNTSLFVKAFSENADKLPISQSWFGSQSLVFVEGETWQRQRRLMNPAFQYVTQSIS